MLAVEDGMIQLLDVLLQYGADPNTSSDMKVASETTVYVYPLIRAAALGNLGAVDRLLKARAEVDARGKRPVYTALAEAAAHGHADIVHLLLRREAKADINVALCMASAKGYTAIVKDLLPKADVDAVVGIYSRSDVTMKGKHTALQAASANGHTSTVKELLKEDINVDIVTEGHFGTALHAAVVKGHLKIVDILLSRNADPNVILPGHGSALHTAVLYFKQMEVKSLLEHNANAKLSAECTFPVYRRTCCSKEIVSVPLSVTRGRWLQKLPLLISSRDRSRPYKIY